MNASPDPLDRVRFPADPWRLIERSPTPGDPGLTETLFAVGNGYLGLRANPEEGRPAYAAGTFINGFHETWQIKHAENAYGFAKTGQTIINAPDAKVMRIYVDDEPLTMGTAALDFYERSLDFRDGILRRSLIWRTPRGHRVKVDTTRMVSMIHRHLAVLTVEVTLLDADAPVVISSQLLNRQDSQDEIRPGTSDSTISDPRKAAAFADRVLIPEFSSASDDQISLGYRAATSGMTVAARADHYVTTSDHVERLPTHNDDLAKIVYQIDASQGATLRLEKVVAYHTSRGAPAEELRQRCNVTLRRAERSGVAALHAENARWWDEFWTASDVVASSDEAENEARQQAIRFNLFSIAQASARADGIGIAAKGVTGSGYEGHYFWDTEIYAVPFLTYTQPAAARNILHFRSVMLPAARQRAGEMALKGALFPWRTINGEEASAYYAAGSAQMHIDADVVYAITKYVAATGDIGFLIREGIDILIETSRMWADLGFWRQSSHGGEESFEIHGVTGPDEYTTVVNNNLFTNVMARYNLEQTVALVRQIESSSPDDYAQIVGRLGLQEAELDEWERCAEAMRIPYDENLGIHPQDDLFLSREVWDLPNTPREVRPLLLHYHPLVIYRFQVLKQADVVLALFLHGDRFSADAKKADFDYYDPITTGDSTLSAVVQSIMAAEVGYHELAMEYFHKALYVDLANLHANTVDGMHIASTGGVWSALVFGFGGMRDFGGRLSFDPRLPEEWDELTFKVRWRESRLAVTLTQETATFVVEEGDGPVTISVRGISHDVTIDSPVVTNLPHHGPRTPGSLGAVPIIGGTRADGSEITSSVPEPSFNVTDPTTGEFRLPAFEKTGLI